MLLTQIKQKWEAYKRDHCLRKRFTVKQRNHTSICIDNKNLIHFASNDYLSIGTDSRVKKAFSEAAYHYGLGSGGSPHTSGYSGAHRRLEESFADFLQRDRALLFNSGYTANLAVLSTFANKHSLIFADKYIHASLIDGIILSRASYKRYQHNNCEHLETLLQRYVNPHRLLITESIFSMEGTTISARKYVDLAKKYQLFFMIDDAHGFGIFGKKGGGVCELFALTQHEVPCLIIPLGKALGSAGAIVVGTYDVIEALEQFARPYRYATALPPAVAAATHTSFTILQNESWRREKLIYLSQFFNKEAKLRGLILSSYDATPIKCVMTFCNNKTEAIQKKLFAKGFFVSAIRPPTVPLHYARIKIVLNALHTEEEIQLLLDEMLQCL